MHELVPNVGIDAVQSACCICTTPLVESVSLTSGVTVPTYLS